MRIGQSLRRWLPLYEAQAHCDIPCGIYDPISAKIAAQTVLKMVMRIQALEYPQDGSQEEHTTYRNSQSRYVTVKEQHAELVKHEVDILWHDYFKPEHVDKYPNLHRPQSWRPQSSSRWTWTPLNAWWSRWTRLRRHSGPLRA